MSVLDVIQALKPLAQPELLRTVLEPVSLQLRKGTTNTTSTVIAPFFRTLRHELRGALRHPLKLRQRGETYHK